MANYNVLTLSEPVTDFVATTSPETINVQCSLSEDAQRKRVWAVCKSGGIPAHPYDGVRVLMAGGAAVAATISGLINDTEYGVRVFVEGAYGYQTALEGATAMATPRAGQPASALPVGAIAKIVEGGTPTDYLVVHQGLPSDMYDTSCNGTWLLRKDAYEVRQWHGSKDNRYASSDIHSYLNGAFLARFESSIQSAIKQVKIPYGAGRSTATVYSGTYGLSAKLFLLAGYEVGFAKSDNKRIVDDGTLLNYFSSGTGSGANKRRLAHLNGTAIDWWLRSPQDNISDYVWLVYADGSYGTGVYVPLTFGVRPACIIPSNMLFSLEPNPDGSYSPIL